MNSLPSPTLLVRVIFSPCALMISFCDGKSETGSGLILSAAWIRFIETVKYFLDRFRWNSDTLILDTDKDFIGFFCDLNRNLPAFRGEFDRIVNQIVDNLLDSCTIRIDNGIVGMEDCMQINAFCPGNDLQRC